MEVPIAVLLLLLLASLPFSFSSDTLLSGQSLSGNATIASQGGLFELGFFSPGASSSSYYLCIRFKNISERTIVWVANRETPLRGLSTSELKLEGGVLVLSANDSTSTPVWSSSDPGPRAPNSTIAVLLDTGNLVVRDGSSPRNSSDYIWQSFDHPTHTVLPGARLGYNASSGQVWKLTSWRSPEDPSSGEYTLAVDPDGGNQFFMLWNGSFRYWSSGLWDGRIFVNVPEMNGLRQYGINRYESGASVYYTYVDHDPAGVSRMVMSFSGQLNWEAWVPDQQKWQVFTYLPQDPCDVYLRCGSASACIPLNPDCRCLAGFAPRSRSDWDAGARSGGCARVTRLACASGNGTATGEKDGFLAITGIIHLPDNSTTIASIGSEDSCSSACSDDCSCTAFSYGNGTCQTWKGDALFGIKKSSADEGASGGSTLYLRLAASDIPVSGGKSENRDVAIIVGATVGGTAAAALVILAALLILRSRRRRRRLQSGVGFPELYRYRELRKATNGFSESLGSGGFGSVYKGSLPDRSAIAVKRLEGARQGEKQFRTEVAAMAAVQHVNVMRLRGFCCHGDSERLLVYDFLPNGSLDGHLLPKSSAVLEWSVRFRIAIGVARGLEYLHDKCRERVIHCDVKPENVLLDEEFRPKVADFGMAKLVGRDFSRVLTTMRGTVGYLAPEWISGSPITEKADVYSFGMMLFELASGRRNFSFGGQGGDDSEEGFFPMWAARHAAEGVELEVVAREKGLDMGEFRRACRVACWCVQDEEERRPAMAEVVQMLEGVVERGAPTIPSSLRHLVPSEDSLVEKLSFYSLVDVP